MKNQNATLEPILLSEETGKISVLKDYVQDLLNYTNEIIQAFKELGIDVSLSHNDVENLTWRDIESVVRVKIQSVLIKDKALSLGKFKLNKSSVANLVELPDLATLSVKTNQLKERLESFNASYKSDAHLNGVSGLSFINVDNDSATIDEVKLNQFITTKLQVFTRNKQQVEVYHAAQLIAETLNSVIIPACRDKYLVADLWQGYSIDTKKLMEKLIACKNDQRKPMVWNDARPEIVINTNFIVNL